MVPSPPLAAVSVVLPQKLPPPLTITWPGPTFTVSMVVAAAVPQIFVIEYEIVTVPPATPVTFPEPLMATSVLLPLHIPPPIPSDKLITESTSTLEGPVITPA